MKKTVSKSATTLTVDAVRAFRKKQTHHESIGKDTSTKAEAQERRILIALQRGPKSTDQLRELGCYQVSARIFGLRSKGHNITTELFNGFGADGYAHAKMARYSLVKNPTGEQRQS